MGSRRVVAVLTVVVIGTCTIAACRSADDATIPPATPDDDIVTVGSFDFAESTLLAELYSQALEAQGFRVRRALELGPREFVAPALAAGLIELLPEYSGTALQFVSRDADAPDANIDATHRELARVLRDHDVTALAASPAQDANTFVVRREVAERYALRRISDLAAVAPILTLGAPPECPSRPLCLVGLEEIYGLDFEEFVPLDAGGPLTRAALTGGVVDVALLFTTDPALTDRDLVELEDDRDLQPAENVTPLVRTAVLEQAGPALARVVDSVSQRLSTDALRGLNAQVAREGADIAAVAAAWLEREGLA